MWEMYREKISVLHECESIINDHDILQAALPLFMRYGSQMNEEGSEKRPHCFIILAHDAGNSLPKIRDTLKK